MMKNRCTNPNYKDYACYGGRGITFEKRWNKFSLFYKDMGPRPSLLHTLDRKDGNKGYSKNNCCWSDKQTQSRNRRFIKTYRDGLTTWEWAEKLGIAQKTFHVRLWKFNTGMIDEAALYKVNTR